MQIKSTLNNNLLLRMIFTNENIHYIKIITLNILLLFFVCFFKQCLPVDGRPSPSSSSSSSLCYLTRRAQTNLWKMKYTHILRIHIFQKGLTSPSSSKWSVWWSLFFWGWLWLCTMVIVNSTSIKFEIWSQTIATKLCWEKIAHIGFWLK